MYLAAERGYQKIAIETDCKNVELLWESKNEDKTMGYHILCEMKEIAGNFQGCK